MGGFAKFVVFLVSSLIIFVSALWIIGGRPNRAASEIWISAQPEEIFSWLVDPEKRTRWVQDLESTTMEVEGDDGTPVKFVSTYRSGDRTRQLEELVQQHDAARFLSLKYDSGGIQTMRVFRLEPEGQRVRLTYEVIQKGLSLWRLKFAVLGTDLQTQVQNESVALKKLAEKNSDTHLLLGEPIR